VTIVIVMYTVTPCGLVHGYLAFILQFRPLLGGNREIGDSTVAVDRQRPANHRRIIFSTRSVPRCYKRGNFEAAVQSVKREDGWCEMAASLGVKSGEWSKFIGDLKNCCGSVLVSCCC
jgi:hypothetical protein